MQISSTVFSHLSCTLTPEVGRVAKNYAQEQLQHVFTQVKYKTAFKKNHLSKS